MIRIPFKEYAEYPAATTFSKWFRVIGTFIGMALLFLCIFSVVCSEFLLAVIFAILLVLHFWVQSKHDTFIRYIVNKSKPQSQIQQELYISEEDLYKAKAYQRKAEYFLSLGPHNKEFKQEAEKAGMSPSEYKKYCKQCVDDYDEKYRRYNLTHTDRADY